jgi:HK97 family phage major capsid protein
MAEKIEISEEKLQGMLSGIVTGAMKTVKEELSADIKAEAEEAKTKAAADKKAADDAAAADVTKKNLTGKAADGTVDWTRTIRFIKAVQSKDEAGLKALGMKAMNSDVDSQGGYLVPEEFSNKIEEIRLSVGLARKVARYVPMKSNVKNMPILADDVLVYYPGQGGVKTSSQFTLGRVRLEAETIAGLTMITDELQEDTDANFVQLIAERFAQALAKEEDRQMLMGTGLPFMGVMNVAGTNLVNMSTGDTDETKVTVAYLLTMIAQLEETILDGAIWIMHRFILAKVRAIKENGQSIVLACNPIMKNDYKGGMVQPSGMLLEHEVYTSSAMPSTAGVSTKFIIFGNFDYYYFGERRGTRMKSNEAAVVGGVSAFETDSSAVRVDERVALAPALPAAFAILVTAAS